MPHDTPRRLAEHMTSNQQTPQAQQTEKRQQHSAARNQPSGRGAPILVLGATGKTGSRVVARLRAAGHTVRAASRTAQTPFDWTDRTTWGPVLEGVGALYLVGPPDPEPIADFVAQARAAGVRRFVVLSGRGIEVYGDSFEPSMAEAERVVREAGVDWTVIRPNNFSQNFDEDVFHEPLLEGRLALPVGDVPEPFIDVEDIAEVAAVLLTEDGHSGRTYELSGPRSLTFAEAVAEMAKASGRPMRFEDITEEAYVAETMRRGMPEDAARSLAAVLTFLAGGHNSAPVSGVREVLGREARDFTEYAKRAAESGAWG